MPTPFVRKVFDFTQPDGSKIQLRGTGNQFQARFETLDGTPVIRNPVTGAYELVGATSTDYVLKSSGIRVGAALSLETQDKIAGAEIVDQLPAMRSTLNRTPTRWQVRRERQRVISQMMRTLGGMPAPPQRQTIERLWD